MDADPDSKLVADNIGMDVEDDTRSGLVVGGMIAEDDTLCVLHPPRPDRPSATYLHERKQARSRAVGAQGLRHP